MPTLRQRKAVENMVENGGVVSSAMISAKYSPNTAKTPQKLTESIGYKELLKEYGLTEGLITKALVDDIKSKPKKRLPELRLGAEILKMTDKEKEDIKEHPQPILNVFIDNRHKENNEDEGTDQGRSRRNISIKDGKHSPVLDTLGTE
jgi:hypothetical protein